MRTARRDAAQLPPRADAADAGRATAASALPLGARDLPRALQGLLRRQVDVDADRALARARPPPASRACVRARGAHRAAGRLGALLRSTAARRLLPPARRARKPGGFSEPTYNLVMGPPLLAPGSLTLVGGIGLAPRWRAASAERWRTPSSGPEPPAQPARRRRRRPERLPRQRRGTTPQMHGRYPDYDVLEQAGHWDEVTRRWSSTRVSEVPPLRFFTPGGGCAARASATSCRPRTPSRASRSWTMSTRSYTRASSTATATPTCPTTARPGAGSARGWTRRRGGAAPTTSRPRPTGRQHDDRRRLRRRRARRRRLGRAAASKAWSVVMRGALSEFYSHPWAWNEIGFGGPAYPRGYMRLSRAGAGASLGGPGGVRPGPGHRRARAGAVSAEDRRAWRRARASRTRTTPRSCWTHRRGSPAPRG